MSGEKIVPTKQYELTCPGAQSTRKTFFYLVILCGQNWRFFLKKGQFLPLNGCKDRQYFAQSCPRGWQRLKPKRSVGATKLFDAVLKVWDNKWDCGGYMPPLHILRRLCAEEIITNHQISSKTLTETKNHHQYPPTKQYVPPKWFLVSICISNGVYRGEKC